MKDIRIEVSIKVDCRAPDGYSRLTLGAASHTRNIGDDPSTVLARTKAIVLAVDAEVAEIVMPLVLKEATDRARAKAKADEAGETA